VLPHLLDPNGLFVLEKHPGERIPATKLWNIVRARKYGATEVVFLSATLTLSREHAKNFGVREEFTRRGGQSAVR